MRYVHRAALPRTTLTVKQFLIDLAEPDHIARKLPRSAETRICRMFWPEKVRELDDIQCDPGWIVYDFSPFSNASDALALIYYVIPEARVDIGIEGGSTRVTIFKGGLHAGAMASDPQIEYALCKGLLNSWLISNSEMYGYVLGMGLDDTNLGHSIPLIHPEEVLAHQKRGDTLRNGLGKD